MGKKKVKLMSTIACLCLSIAMMMFGIFAATNVSFNLSSTVSYTVYDVFVEITGHVYLETDISNRNNELEELRYGTVKSYTGTIGTDANPISPGQSSANLQSWDIGEISFTSTNDCIIYALEIKNVAKSGTASVKFTNALPKTIAGTQATATYTITNGASGSLSAEAINVPAQQTLNVVITRELINKTASIPTGTSSWDPSILISNTEKSSDDILETGTITYTLNGGTDGNNVVTFTKADLPITLNNSLKLGSNFLGWYDSENNKVTEITTVENIALEARFEESNLLFYYVGIWEGSEVEGAALYGLKDYSVASVIVPETAVVEDDKGVLRELPVMYIASAAFIEDKDTMDDYGWNWTDKNTEITSIILPDCLEFMAWGSFANCVSLTSIILPETSDSVIFEAFMGCDSLEYVYYKGNSEDINWASFGDYTAVVNVYGEPLDDYQFVVNGELDNNSGEMTVSNFAQLCFYSETKPADDDYEMYWYYDEGGNIVFWDVNIQYILDGGLGNDANIKSFNNDTHFTLKAPITTRGLVCWMDITTKKAVKIIEGKARRLTLCCILGSEGLLYTNNGTEATLAGIGTCTDTELLIATIINADGTAEYQVTSVGTEAFLGNTQIQRVVLPETLKIIHEKAFYNCTNLAELTIFEKYFTTNTNTVIVGESEKELTCSCFPNSLEEIGSQAFVGCEAILNSGFFLLNSNIQKLYTDFASTTTAWCHQIIICESEFEKIYNDPYSGKAEYKAVEDGGIWIYADTTPMYVHLYNIKDEKNETSYWPHGGYWEYIDGKYVLNYMGE